MNKGFWVTLRVSLIAGILLTVGALSLLGRDLKVKVVEPVAEEQTGPQVILYFYVDHELECVAPAFAASVEQTRRGVSFVSPVNGFRMQVDGKFPVLEKPSARHDSYLLVRAIGARSTPAAQQ